MQEDSLLIGSSKGEGPCSVTPPHSTHRRSRGSNQQTPGYKPSRSTSRATCRMHVEGAMKKDSHYDLPSPVNIRQAMGGSVISSFEGEKEKRDEGVEETAPEIIKDALIVTISSQPRGRLCVKCHSSRGKLRDVSVWPPFIAVLTTFLSPILQRNPLIYMCWVCY